MRGVSSSSSLQSAVPKSGVGRCTGTRSSGGRRMKTTQKQQQQQPSSSLRASRDDHHHRRRWQQEEEPVRESQQQDQGKVPRANEDHFDDANQRRRETIWLTALGVVLVVASAVLLGILLPARGREDDGSNPSAAFESNGTPSLRPTHVPIDSSSWISLSVLVLQQQSLNANEVTVSSGTVAVIDESIDMGPNAILNIRGEVRCQDNTYIGDDGGRSRSNEEPIVLRLAGITVTGSNAVLSCGTANRPYRGQDLVIELIGTTDVDVAGYGSSAIVVANGGTISLHGKDESKSRYVRLSRTMESGSTFAMVVDVDDSGSSMVSSWEKGDTVVISTTSFYPDRNDYLTVRSVRREGWDDNGGGDFVVEFERPAKWRHYGEIQVFGRGDGHRQRQRRHVVDERAYVANLSRNIRIRGGGVGPDDRGGDTNNIFGVGGGSGIGAHVIITRGGHAYVDSVELEHVGQLGIVGRYPFHWHRVGDASGQYIRNCAIHASYNRCVTIHNTQNAEVTGNTCADFLGHGYFLEEGNEVGNIIQNNLGIDCRKSSNLGTRCHQLAAAVRSVARCRRRRVGRPLPPLVAGSISHEQVSSKGSEQGGKRIFCAFNIQHRISKQHHNSSYKVAIRCITSVAEDQATLLSDYNSHPGDRYPGPAIYWVSNPNNVINNNVAVGSEGSGFWMAYVRGLECDDGDEGSVGRGSGSCRLSSSLEEGGANVFPVTTPTLRFSDNVVMSAVTCFTWDGAPDGAHLPNDRNEEVGAAGDYALRHAHYRPDGQVPVYSNLHAYKCARTGMYYRGEQAHFPSAVFADIGGVGAFFTYNQVLKESALASMSANHDEDERRYHFDPSVDHQRRNGHGRSVGIYIYDGPFVLDNVLFADFSPTQVLYNGRDITPLPMAVVGSAQRFVNVAKQVSFEPEPYLRFNMAHRNNWQDSYGAGVVDLVGDLTGYPGRTIVPMDHEDLRLSMNYYPGCEALTKESALVCDYNMGHLQMHNALAFDIARTDGPAIDHIPSEVGKHLNKIPVIIKEGSGIEYRLTGLTFGPRPSIRVVFNSHLGDISPLVEIASLISAPCSFDRITMNGAQELYSLDQVRKASSTSYAVDATTNSLYFRIKATEQRQNISPESEQGIAIIELQCM